MKQLTENITRIQGKLQEVLKRYVASRKEVEAQQKIITSLQQQQELQQKKIRALEEQSSILKAAAGNMNGADRKGFEQTINKYIREIDKCIDLLSE